MNIFKRCFSAVIRLIELQDDWARGTSKPFQFSVLAVCSFLAYSSFLAVGKLELAQINKIIEGFITDPSVFVIGSYIVLISLVGLYFSVLAASALASLVSKSKR